MVRGASLLILLQLLSRLASFVANQLLLVRLLTPPQLGVAAQLDVYGQSVLAFSRDALRVAVARRPAHADDDARAFARADQAVVNLGHVAAAAAAPVAGALARLFLASAGPAARAACPRLGLALRLHAAAALVELLAEPAFALAQARLRLRVRAAAEALATLARGLVVAAAAVAARRRRGDDPPVLLPLALGQLAYASALLLVYLVAARRRAAAGGFSLAPRPVSPPAPDFLLARFHRPTLRLAATLELQGVVKHLLTRGDTLLVSALAGPTVQGVYALASNYGGLVARLVFQPVDESSRAYFSRLLHASSPPPPPPTLPTPSPTLPTSPPRPPRPSAPVLEARRSLATLARLYLVLSAAVVALGPFAAPSLLALVAGPRWAAAGAGRVLATYCLYVPFLALNGLAESFVASVATERQLHRQSLWMAAFSLAFAAAAYLLMRVYPLGAHGLVLANVVNMLCRIVWSAAFAKAFFRSRRAHFSVASLLPRSTLAASLSTFSLLRRLDVLDKAESEPLRTLAKVAGSAVPLLLMM